LAGRRKWKFLDDFVNGGRGAGRMRVFWFFFAKKNAFLFAVV
jgi:hypothetical protein